MRNTTAEGVGGVVGANTGHTEAPVSQHKRGDVTQTPALISTEEDTEATRVQTAGSSAPPNQPQDHVSEGRSRCAQTQT